VAICYALRLVADSGTGLGWLRWTTPLGWIEQMQPLTSPRPILLLPVSALVAVELLLAIQLSGSRDIGSGVLSDRDESAAHTRLLSGSWGLTIRLELPGILTWGAAICALSLLMGLIAKQGGAALASSTSVERVVTRLGARGSGAAHYMGFVFLAVEVLIAFVAVGQLSACRSEEACGRLEELLAGDVSRTWWLSGRIAIGVLVIVANGSLAGFFGWSGALTQGTGLGLVQMLAAGVNTAAPAAVVLGFGILAFGVVPRLCVAVAYSVIAWSLLADIVAGASNSNHWLEDTSIFHQVAAAPAVSPEWVTVAAMVGIALACVAAGGIAFTGRDLAGE